MLKKFKDLGLVFVLLLLVAGLVILRSAGENHFKENATGVIEAVNSGRVFITPADLIQKDYFIIGLNESHTGKRFQNSQPISFSDLDKQETLNLLKTAGKKILIVSEDPGLASRAWVFLNQSGVKELYILTDSDSPEMQRYPFRPDTTAALKSEE